jgi:hypothetical protein
MGLVFNGSFASTKNTEYAEKSSVIANAYVIIPHSRKQRAAKSPSPLLLSFAAPQPDGMNGCIRRFDLIHKLIDIHVSG